MKTNNKKPSALKLWLLRVIPTALIGTLTMAASCGKEPQPTPPTPTPDPVEPTKVITMDFDWRTPFNTAINLKEIKNLTDQPDVKNVCMNLVYTEESTMTESAGYPTSAFHTARDSLQKRFDISPKVIGSGTIIVSREGGAQQYDQTGLSGGMNLEDSIWYASKGFKIERKKALSK